MKEGVKIFRGLQFLHKKGTDCLKRELGQLADLIGGLAKKKGWCF